MVAAKRRRSDADSKAKESPLVREDATKAPAGSILESSEVAFPRGGASVLTPLELKEVANEATRDVLFEKESSRGTKTEDTRPAKKKKSSKTSSAISKPSISEDQEVVPIESLSFKSLIPGTLVLGQVSAINRMELVLALPDNLVGYVPVTSISSEVTKQLEELDQSDEEDSDDDNDDAESSSEKITSGTTNGEKTFPGLSKLFKVDQWLRAVVVESTNLNTKNQKKRIQMSIEPSLVNKVMELDDLTPNSTIQVSVKSVEDHGAILNLGKEELNGFISNKELKAASIEPELVQRGTVYLTTISNNNSRTVTVKLNTTKKNVSTAISSIESIVPGNLIEVVVREVKNDGLIFKAYGMVNATASLSHIGEFNHDELKHKFAIGSKIKARVISVLTVSDAKKIVLSFLPHVLSFDSKHLAQENLEAFPVGHVFEDVEVQGFDSNYIFVKVSDGKFGQIHISRVDPLKPGITSHYSEGTHHQARVIGYSHLDNYYSMTFDPKVIKQKYLSAQDIPIGALVNGEVMSVSDKGLQVKIFDKFEAHVPLLHMSDVKLIYPERKFKIGSKVKSRVLNISKYRSEIILTLKKSLVGTENPISTIEQAHVGTRTAATVLSFKPSGVIVSFFGDLKAYLPKSEISETFVRKPEDHLRLGQTISVRVASVDQNSKRISVSCRLSEESTEDQKKALESLVPGRSIVTAQIVEKTKDSVVVELPGNNLRGVIFAGHLSDGNYEQNRAILKRLKTGTDIEGLVLDKDARSRIFNLSAKTTLIDAAKEGTLPIKYKDIEVSDNLIPGYVKSVTNKGVFVGFGAKLVGLILAKYATERPVDDLSSLFQVNQSVSVRVLRTDEENRRFLLTLKERKSNNSSAVNPVDSTLKSLNDCTPGRITQALIKSVKQTQLNVQLADNIQGRVDVSQIFDSFDDIKDSRKPLSHFKKGETLKVKIIGYHDARNHTFLPITHKRSKQTIIELSAKKSDLETSSHKPLNLDEITVGTEWTGFINNSTKGFFFVNLSPSVKGKISFMDLSSNVSLLNNIDDSYPIGSALKVRVKSVDPERGVVLLTGRDDDVSSIEKLTVGMSVPARILKVSESYVIVEIAENLSAISFITDALNDYTKKLGDIFSQNDIVGASVLEIDESNQKIYVSLRSNESTDKLISSSSDLNRGDVVRGFIKNVTDKGVFVSLGRTVTAYVKVSDLSDSFIKDWKKFFKVHQPVVGKVINSNDGSVSMTLKESEVNGELNILKRFEDLKIGDVFEGSVKRVTDFGVFVKLDNCINITGLCHHSEISDNPVRSIGGLFGEGDRVKVKILSVDNKKKQLSLGMKASYFQRESDDEGDDTEMLDAGQGDEDVSEVFSAENDDDEQEELAEAFDDYDASDVEDEDSEHDSEDFQHGITGSNSGGLSTNGFEWTANILDQAQIDDSSDDEENFTEVRTKKKRKSKQVVEDTTGDINSKTPQSVADFERLIIGNPDSSIVWINYMAFQLQLSEIEKAREIGERALKTINYREEQEKLNIWVALLNLEVTFGSEEGLEDVFKRANEYMDPLTIHQKTAELYISSENYAKADALFKLILKKFGKSSVSVWVNYGTFLLGRKEEEKAHDVLAKALTSLPKRDHIEVVRKFAQLEFNKGNPEQGRTLFEGLVADVPKRIDLWNVYIDQEIKMDEKKKVEDLFERVFTRKISRKQAKFFFAKWLAFEEKKGDVKGADYVKAKAQEYVQKHESS